MLGMMGLGVGKAIYGGLQMNRAKKARDQNVRPEYDIPDEFYENESMYEELAQEGLPQDELSRLHQQSMRGLSASLSAGLQMGGSANTVNDYYQSYLDNASDIGLKNSLQRFANINQLANARNAVAEQEFIKFSYNEDAPYKDRAQAATQGQVQGMANLTGGIDTAFSAFAYDKAADTYQDRINTQNKTLGLGPTVNGNIDPNNPDITRQNVNLDDYWTSMKPVSRPTMGPTGSQDYVPSSVAPSPTAARAFNSPEEFYLHQLITNGRLFQMPQQKR